MTFSREEIDGLSIALNEATWLGGEVDTETCIATLTFAVFNLPQDSGPAAERRIQFVLSPVSRVAASLLEDRTPGLRAEKDANATVVPFGVDELMATVQSFGGCPIYGWEFIDGEPNWLHSWGHRLSLDWRADVGTSAHTLTLFQDGITRELEARFWFNELRVLDQNGAMVPIDQFIAAGKRWWDGLYAKDPRTKVAGIFPLKMNPHSKLDEFLSDANDGYLKQPFPSKTDHALTAFLQRTRTAGTSERASLLAGLTDAHSFTFLSFAERMATQALRDRDPQHLEDGLLAVAVENARFDARENLLVLSLLHRSATILGQDAERLFADAAVFADSELKVLMKAFPNRPDAVRSIEAMGYREVNGPDGPSYERIW